VLNGGARPWEQVLTGPIGMFTENLNDKDCLFSFA